MSRRGKVPKALAYGEGPPGAVDVNSGAEYWPDCKHKCEHLYESECQDCPAPDEGEGE